jgi:hypothetical protein
MNDLELHFWATAALCAGPVLFLRGFRDLRLHRLIQNTPTSRIRSMAMGLAEVHGTVLQRSSVRAPFTRHPCAYWEVEIAIRVSQKHGWTTVYRETSGQPFYVDDGTGVALVYPKGSMCRVPFSAEEECLGASLPDLYSEYMAERRIWRRHLWRFSQMRFREHRVEEGETIYVLGSAEPRSLSRDVSSPERLDDTREVAIPSEPAEEGADVRATGTDGRAPVFEAGTIVAAGAFRPLGLHPGAVLAAHGVMQRRRARDAGPTRLGPGRLRSLHERVVAVIRRGRNDPTFLISRDSEQVLSTKLGFSTFGKLVGGPVLAVFGLIYWLIVLAPFTGAR